MARRSTRREFLQRSALAGVGSVRSRLDRASGEADQLRAALMLGAAAALAAASILYLLISWLAYPLQPID